MHNRANESASFGDFWVLGSNFTKFLSFLNQQISFSWHFASIFRIIRYNSSLLFSQNFLYFKEPIESSRKSEILDFDGLLLSKSCTFSAKQVQKSYLSWHWTVIQSFFGYGEIQTHFSWKTTWEIWWILTWAVKNLKICTLMGYFCQKYVTFELKQNRRVVSWKMIYGFKNDIRNLVNFNTNSWK